MIHQGDANLLLLEVPSGSVDAIITDPPYGTNDGRGKRQVKLARGDNVPFEYEWDRDLPLQWFTEGFRVLKPGGSLMMFTDNLSVGTVWDALDAVGFRGRHLFFWYKPDAPPTPRQNFASAVESGVFAVKPDGPFTWNGGGWTHNHFVFKLAHKYIDGMTRFHPTQKPVPLMEALIALVTNPGDLVLDPFAGSASTGVAALQLDRRFLGFESDPDFAEIAARRLETCHRPANDAKLGKEMRGADEPDLIGDLFG